MNTTCNAKMNHKGQLVKCQRPEHHTGEHCGSAQGREIRWFANEAEAASARLGPKTKEAINRGLCKAGLDGNTYFPDRATAYRRACKVLGRHAIQIATVVGSYELLQPTLRADLELPGPTPFEPLAVSNSMLVLSLAEMNTGIEAIAYLS
jgi:hypothetical protein